jgi:hypothetical protein
MLGILKLTPDAAHQPNRHGVITKQLVTKASDSKVVIDILMIHELDVLSIIKFIYMALPVPNGCAGLMSTISVIKFVARRII